MEQPAQVTACGQAALKGAACGISEPGGRWRKQPSAGVPRACAFRFHRPDGATGARAMCAPPPLPRARHKRLAALGTFFI
ncbi:hypothetical protein E2R25_05770 [Burkholderia pseudomallei]|nr:hypothetical protein E2R25_05770 [Burkholderia pseudomallei]QBR23266.1 hypothetical protein E3O37_05745 [Burkholderia pseudomallei]